MTTTGQQRVLAFWGEPHWRNQYRLLPPAHSGFDIGGHRAGTMIPALRAGVIAAKGHDKNYGNWVSWRVSRTVYLIVCHMLRESPQEVGDRVEVGEGLGQVGASGAFAVGFHCHLSESLFKYPWTRPTINPKPLIVGALKAASKPTIPAGNPGKPITATEDSMYIAVNENNSNEAARRLLVTSVSAKVITAEQSKVYVAIGVPWATVPKADWLVLYNDGLARVAELKGSGSTAAAIDLSPILDAIKQIPTTVINLLKAQWSK